jgi:hypothetical protein
VLREHTFAHIGVLDFSYFLASSATGTSLNHNQMCTSKGNAIKILFSRREPAAKLTGEDEGKLLVAMFAWDSNAFVGNEYWINMLDASGLLLFCNSFDDG